MTSQRTRNRLVERLRASGTADERVLAAIASVPRHIFVDEALAHRAYEDDALPIGNSQTISQPQAVAAMTEAILGGAAGRSVAPRPLGRVLEIGTGSGYQTAVLATLAERVYTVERIGALLRRARDRFRLLSLHNVRARHADGRLGWPEAGPFDAVLVTAGAGSVPETLKRQLAHGARLVMPVGDADAQQLVLLERDRGGWRRSALSDVRFVPLREGVAP